MPHARLEQRTPLADWPSPVRDISSLRDGLFVKDDGHCHAAYAGNKVRKLEYLLPGAAETIVTFGAMGSHHALATAVHATAHGHRVEVVTHPRVHTPHAEQVLRATMPLARIHWCDSHESAKATLQAAQDRATVIPAGGSTPIGALGFVRAALELADQIKAGELPCPEKIFVATGTAGTLAGLAVGMKLAGLSTDIVGVRVCPSDWLSESDITQLCEQTASLVGGTVGPWTIDDRWLGGGYAVDTAQASQAVELATQHGLSLETCYTGKAFAAALAEEPGPHLFWQTHNQIGIEPLADQLRGGIPTQWRWQDA
jgi:D-cysteine desulfhydrase